MENLIRKLFTVPTYARQSEALQTIIRHSTPKRLLNLLTVEWEYRLRKERLRGRPYILVVDPINVCNLRCPLCPTGLLQQGRKGQQMQWEDFTALIDQMAPWAYKVNLFNWGESLLHEHIFDMIEYVRSKNLGTTLSTNLSLKLEPERLDRLVTSGLEFVCLSIDGATQETYEKYRRKGDLSLVLENIRRLVARKRELNSKTPVVEWQFIPMRHNEHEVATARQLAFELGVDRFRCIPVGLPFAAENKTELAQEWFPVSGTGGHLAGESMTSNDPAETPCYFLYRYLIVNPDVTVSPCCVVAGKANDFGELRNTSFEALWNNTQYRSARSHYRDQGKVECATVCDTCDLFKKRATNLSAVKPES